MEQPKTKKSPSKSAIKDVLNLANQGIIFKDHSALQAIYQQSGPLADSCEFQVHYWALVFRHTAADSSIFDIAIPVVYFNYAQEVSGARIDFDMSEVSTISTKLAPVAQMEAGKLLATPFKSAIESAFGIEFTPMLTELNTIHKHPGGSTRQSFSGTDLDTKADDHGVVYPLASASNSVPNFAGIMALDYKVNNTAHFEYRLVNGTLGTDITYEQGRCLAITVKPTQQQSAIEALLKHPKPADFTVRSSHSTVLAEDGAFISRLVEIYRSIDYTPFTKAIAPSNLTRKSYTSGLVGTGGVNPGLFSRDAYKAPTKDPVKPQGFPKILDEAELKTLGLRDLREYIVQLETYYLEYPSDIRDFEYYTAADLIDEIIDLQITIVSELPLSRDELITELTKAGFARSALLTKSTEALQTLYDYQG